jgi:hypothetical protein
LSKKSTFFSFRRSFFNNRIPILWIPISFSVLRGRAKVLESLGYLLFIVPKGEVKALESLGYLSFIVPKGKAKALKGLSYLSIIVN